MDSRKAPLRQELPSPSFPSLRELPAPAGWRCYVLRDDSTDIVACQLLFPVGSVHARQPGLAHLTLRSLLRGTQRLPAEFFHEQLEALGASVGVNVGLEWSSLSCTCLRSVWPKVSELVEQMLVEPALSSEEILRERQRQIATLLEWCQDPEALAQYALFQLWTPRHPYSVPTLGLLPALQQLTPERVREWFATAFQRATPRLLLLGGAVTEEEAVRWLERLSGALPLGNCAPDSVPSPQWRGGVVGVIDKEAAVQGALVLGLPAPQLTAPDYVAAYAVTMALGGHFLSRLNRQLREHDGLTYGVSASLHSFRQCGLALIEGAFALEQIGRACGRIREELDQLQHAPISLDELQRVVRVVYGAVLRQLATLHGALGLYAKFLVQGLSPSFPQGFLERLRSLQPEELLPVQRQYFNPRHTIVAASGRSEQLAKQLADFGEVHFVHSACAEQEAAA
ncbi:MAG: pitrilysin family protein [Chlorobiota bacterium]